MGIRWIVWWMRVYESPYVHDLLDFQVLKWHPCKFQAKGGLGNPNMILITITILFRFVFELI